MSLQDCLSQVGDLIHPKDVAFIRKLVDDGYQESEIVNSLNHLVRKDMKDLVARLRENGIEVKEKTKVESDYTSMVGQGEHAAYVRGYKGYYDPANTLIRLSNAADLSTWFHEFGHFILDMEVRTNGTYVEEMKDFLKQHADIIAERVNNNKDADKVTIQEVKDFIDNYKEAAENPSPIEKEMHEFFARSFEKYLTQDKIIPKSKGVFRYVAQWLREVHSRVGLGTSAETPEMTKVFDALVMTDEMLYQRELVHKYDFTVAELEDIIRSRRKDNKEEKDKEEKDEDEEEASIKDLKRKNEEAKQEAREKLRARLFNEIHRRERPEYIRKLQSIAKDKLKVILESKDYVAKRKLVSDLQLDRKVLKEHLSAKGIKKIPYSLRGVSLPKGGEKDIAMVSKVLGYKSVDDMLTTLMSLPKAEDVAMRQAEAEMEQKHGTLRELVSKMVDEAMVSEKRAIALIAELKMLRKGQEEISPSAIRELAANTIAKLTPKEVNIRQYRSRELHAARKGAVALSKGDLNDAADWKAIELSNHYLQLEARKYLDIHEKLVGKRKTLNKKSSTLRKTLSRNSDAKYYEHYNNILAQIGLGKIIPTEHETSEWYLLQKQQHKGIVINGYVFEYAGKDIKDIPLGVQQGILDALDSIYHIAKTDGILREKEKAILLNSRIEDAVRVIEKNSKIQDLAKVSDQVKNDNIKEKATKTFRSVSAWLTKIPWMMVFLDGGKRMGINYDLVYRPIYDGYNTKMKLMRLYKKPIADMISNFSEETKEHHKRIYYIPEAVSTDPVDGTVINDGHMSGSQLLMVVLNSLNKSNREKMIKGEGWGNDLTVNNPVIQAAINKLTKEDFEFVNAVWKMMDELYKPFADTHRRATGKFVEKIEAEQFETKYGTLIGGYFPMVYDTTRGGVSSRKFRDRLRELEEMQFSGFDDLYGGEPSSAKGRVENYAAPLNLRLGVIDGHFTKVIHYIALREAVSRVNDVITDERYKRAVIQTMGEEHYRMLPDWLSDVAKEGQYIDSSPLDNLARNVNGSLTVMYMGYKLSTFLLQVLGLSVSASEVGSKNLAAAIMEIAKGDKPSKEVWDAVITKSEVMRNRIHTMDRELQNAIRLYSEGESFLRYVNRHAMTHIAYMQTYVVDFPTWLASYKKGLNDFEGDEDKAIQYADFVVENMQGSGSVHNMAKAFRNQKATHQMYTLFMTFFSAQLMIQRDMVRGVREGYYDIGEAFRRFLWVLALPTALEMLLRGDVGDDDEPEDIGAKYLVQLGSTSVAGIPILRNIYDYATTNYGNSVAFTPLVSEMGRAGQVGTALEKLMNGEDPTDAQWRALFRQAALISGALGYAIPGVGQAMIIEKNFVEKGDYNPWHLAFPPRDN